MQIVTSVGWMQDGAHLVCGLDTGRIQIWDVERTKLLRTLKTEDENERIAAVHLNSHLLTQGNRLGTLRNHDLRIAEHEVMTRKTAHSQEVSYLRILIWFNILFFPIKLIHDASEFTRCVGFGGHWMGVFVPRAEMTT